MSETRVQAAQLLCRIFLHYLVALSEWGGMVELWVRILGVMDRLMNSGQGDTLEEAVNENMKNILLVMQSGGYLAPPEEKPEQKELWEETWKRLNRFLPGLYRELYPEEVEKPRRSGSVKQNKAKEQRMSGEREVRVSTEKGEEKEVGKEVEVTEKAETKGGEDDDVD